MNINGPIALIVAKLYELLYREVSLQASHYSFIIVYGIVLYCDKQTLNT